jgi:hypothetical protein
LAHDQRASGVALDQQDHLAIPEQWGNRSRDHRLSIAAGHNDDDIGAIDRRFEIRRRALNRSKAASLAFDIRLTTRANFGELCIVDIVEAQVEPAIPNSAAR